METPEKQQKASPPRERKEPPPPEGAFEFWTELEVQRVKFLVRKYGGGLEGGGVWGGSGGIHGVTLSVPPPPHRITSPATSTTSASWRSSSPSPSTSSCSSTRSDPRSLGLGGGAPWGGLGGGRRSGAHPPKHPAGIGTAAGNGGGGVGRVGNGGGVGRHRGLRGRRGRGRRGRRGRGGGGAERGVLLPGGEHGLHAARPARPGRGAHHRGVPLHHRLQLPQGETPQSPPKTPPKPLAQPSSSACLPMPRPSLWPRPQSVGHAYCPHPEPPFRCHAPLFGHAPSHAWPHPQPPAGILPQRPFSRPRPLPRFGHAPSPSATPTTLILSRHSDVTPLSLATPPVTPGHTHDPQTAFCCNAPFSRPRPLPRFGHAPSPSATPTALTPSRHSDATPLALATPPVTPGHTHNPQPAFCRHAPFLGHAPFLVLATPPVRRPRLLPSS